MKKYLLMLFGIVSFLGINSVKADTIDYEYTYYNFGENLIRSVSTFASDFISKSSFTFEEIDPLVDQLISDWEENYKSEYPYYFIYLGSNVNGSTTGGVRDWDYVVALVMLSIPPYNISDFEYFNNGNNYPYSYHITSISVKNKVVSEIENGPNDLRSFIGIKADTSPTPDEVLPKQYYLPFMYYDSNFDMYYDLEDTARIIKDEVVIGTYNNGDLFPTYKQLFNLQSNGYTTIDLNDYSYVVLSLKDYSNVPVDNNSTYTNIYVQGQLCLTPVYNYGSTERKDVISGTQVQRCSSYYDQETSLRTYILQSDVKNHAIYYIKSYDTSKTNIIRVDSSIFNISYITQENEDNPIAVIDGKNYPILSYSSLTDTSTKSEDEGYISGVSCPLGDINCSNQYSTNFFDGIFDSPLQMLKSFGSMFTNFFSMIAIFISLLPTGMQTVLLSAFTIAIVLGIIKIIL